MVGGCGTLCVSWRCVCGKEGLEGSVSEKYCDKKCESAREKVSNPLGSCRRD